MAERADMHDESRSKLERILTVVRGFPVTRHPTESGDIGAGMP
jgi:hypothetical protein